MKKIPFLFLFSIVLSSLSGQQIGYLRMEVVCSGGNSISEYTPNQDHHLFYTVGEAVTYTLSNQADTLVLTQGFRQPAMLFGVAVRDAFSPDLFRVFPNPAWDSFSLEFESPTSDEWYYGLFTLEGRLITYGKLGFGNYFLEAIDASQLASGMHVIMLYNVDKSKMANKKVQIIK